MLSAPWWLLRRAGAASLRRLPYIQNLTSESVSVLWTTDASCEGEVRFTSESGRSGSAVARSIELSPAQTALESSYWRHCAVLGSLQPGTRYSYQVHIDGQPMAVPFHLTFHTPAAAGPFRFLAFGDSGIGSAEQVRLRDGMTAEAIDFVLHTGDIAYPVGSFESFQQNYLDVYRDLMYRVPFFPSPGNHGYMTADAFPHLTVHEVPSNDVPSDLGRYYSFDWCGCHFIALDSNAPLSAAARGAGPMLKWLENDLKRASGRFWKIAYFHHPPYGYGPNELDTLTALAREHITPILERHGVQLVLNGHEHSYQRSHSIRGGRIIEQNRGTTYITTGGGGNGVYPVHPNAMVVRGEPVHHYVRVQVDGTRLRAEAVGIDGRVFDSVSLAPKPEVTAEAVASLNAEPGRHAASGVVSIYGSSFGRTEEVAVELGGQAAQVLFASAGQINAVLPAVAAGDHELTVRNANGETRVRLGISRSAPGIVAVAHGDGSLVTPLSPAARDEELLLFAAGLGGGGQELHCDAEVLPMRPETAPGLAGVSQARFRVPSSAGAKAVLRIRTPDAVSPALTIDVR